jgi:hypothetical protein
MTGSVSIAALVLALAMSAAPAVAHAGEPPPVFQGTWIATADASRPFAGRWSAQALPGEPDEVQGSWSMVNDAGDTVAQGTWSARRSKGGFKGKWWARTATGGSFKGTFEAHLPGFKGKTLEDMFVATKTAQISGFWRMGRAHGAWYLKGAAPPS